MTEFKTDRNKYLKSERAVQAFLGVGGGGGKCVGSSVGQGNFCFQPMEVVSSWLLPLTVCFYLTKFPS